MSETVTIAAARKCHRLIRQIWKDDEAWKGEKGDQDAVQDAVQDAPRFPLSRVLNIG